MRRDQDNALEAVMEQLIENGSEEMASVVAGLFNFAMRIERERFLGAGHYERTPERRGYANGTRPKKIDTPAGTVTVEVPETAGHEEPFYPQALERGRRSCRAVMLAVAEMYTKGVSTRDVEAVMRQLGLERLSSTQVSRAAKLLDEELEAWRNRPLGDTATCCSTRATRKSARAAWCAMPPCSRPSASAPTSAAGRSASPAPSRRPKHTGAPSWIAS